MINEQGKYFLPRKTIIYVAEIDTIYPMHNSLNYGLSLKIETDIGMIFDFGELRPRIRSDYLTIDNKKLMYIGMHLVHKNKKNLVRFLLEEKDLLRI